MTIAEQKYLESVPTRLMSIEKELSDLNRTLTRIADSLSKRVSENKQENNKQMED